MLASTALARLPSHNEFTVGPFAILSAGRLCVCGGGGIKADSCVRVLVALLFVRTHV